jgi:two-component system, OmpR family, sensor histidine kinase KdpD
MLDEAHRRTGRGTDVVAAWVDARGRPVTETRLHGLEVVPPLLVVAGNLVSPQVDREAVLARRPQVALVDDLGASWEADGHRCYRWHDVEVLLAAGIDVIATLDVGSIDSLADIVSELTGRVRAGRVPDSVVVGAQIELVDMAPEAVRRRLAHGNIVEVEQLDTAMAKQFDPVVLAAVRELTVTWLAEHLRSQRGRSHAGPAASRDRIMIALSGAPDGERLIGRAARLAARLDGDLLGVLAIFDEPDRATAERLVVQRQLLEHLGGTYHEVRGHRVVDCLLQVVDSERVSHLVLGASPRNWRGRSLVDEVLAWAGELDVHVVGGSSPLVRRRALPLPGGHRQATAALMAAVLLPLVTALLVVLRDQYSLSVALLAYVVVVVAVTSIGGAAVGVGCALAAFLCANFFFTEPLHTFTVTDFDDGVALVVFLIVTAIVSVLVSQERRQATDADAASQEAEAVAVVAAVLSRAPAPVAALVEHLSRALGDRPAALERMEGEVWQVVVARGGALESSDPALLAVDDRHRLRIDGEPLALPLRRLATAVASQLAAALQADGLRRASERDRARAVGDGYRTALLRAVSHDLRTPLTSIKTSVSSLLSHEVSWTADETEEFLDVIDTEADRLERLIVNLLDMSRLETGGIHARLTAVDAAEVVAAALATLTHLGPGRCRLLIDDDAVVDADPALLERIVANLVANADRAAPDGSAVTIRVGIVDAATAQIQVVDQGPGIARHLRDRAVEPFSRLDGRAPGAGLGLGLAIVEGFVSALRGQLTLEDTPGGGLTATVRLPRATQGGAERCPRPSSSSTTSPRSAAPSS